MKRRRVRGSFRLALVLCASVAQAEEAGKATGTLSVGASKVLLAYAYAIPEKGHSDPAKEGYRIFLTDKPMPASALTDEFERQLLWFEHKIQGIEAVVTADNDVVSTQMYGPGLGATGTGTTGANFERTASNKNAVVGRLRYDLELNPTYQVKGQPITSFEATLSAPIFRRRPLTKANLESEPASLARAFAKAATARDRAALQKVLTVEDAKDLDGPKGKEILEDLSGAGLDRMAITWIEVTGDTAKVFLETQDGSGKIKLTLARENQQWKVSNPGK